MFINSMAYCVSNQTFDLDSCYEHFGLSRAESIIYKRFYGFVNCRKDNLTLKEMMFSAFQKLMKGQKADTKNIKWIMHCHTGKIIEPEDQHIIYDIKKSFGLRNAICFGTTINNCSSTFACLSLCESLLQDNDVAIIFNADLCFYRTLKIIKGSAICAPGCSVIMVSKVGVDHNLKSISLKVDPTYYAGIEVESVVKDPNLNSAYIKLLKDTIFSVCEKAQVNLSDIKRVIPHNVTLVSWKSAIKEIGIPLSIIYLDGISKYGHMFGSDNWIGLINLIEDSKLMKGDYYLLVNSGLGFIDSAAVIQY